jgi:uncharacterized protein (TIGR00299 family) protein
MKRILYFDCVAGISGDMTLGALIHLGADAEILKNELEKLPVGGYTLIPEKWSKDGTAGINLHVMIEGEFPERCFSEICGMIADSGLALPVKKTALSIFTVIAEAEATAHGIALEKVAFHEKGAVDSIVDIVGTAICVNMLRIDAIFCSPVHDGKGFIECRRGVIPVPVPAVAEMLSGSGISIVTEDVNIEMVTPTGFGILKGLGAKCAQMPEMDVHGVGFGFGKRDTGRFNALRVTLGTILDGVDFSGQVNGRVNISA